MIVENEKGEKEILIDAQSFQYGYRSAVKDLTGDPRETSVRIIAFVLVACFAYVILSLLSRDN